MSRSMLSRPKRRDLAPSFVSKKIADERSRPSRNAGFTIVETLIVLAIAGLILLIVFEAIPALERSGRNNQRRQDVQAILAAVSHYELNNSGNLPTTAGFLTYTKLSYYNRTVQFNSTPSNGIGVYLYVDSAHSPSTLPGNTSPDTVEIHDYQKCNATAVGKSTNIGAGYNDIVALYGIEAGSNAISQCQQL